MHFFSLVFTAFFFSTYCQEQMQPLALKLAIVDPRILHLKYVTNYPTSAGMLTCLGVYLSLVNRMESTFTNASFVSRVAVFSWRGSGCRDLFNRDADKYSLLFTVVILILNLL